MFLNTKIISSVYAKSFEGVLSKSMAKKVQFDEIEEGLDKLSSPTYDSLIDLMIEFSDAIVLSSDKIDKSTEKIIKNSSKPLLSYKNSLNESLFMEFFAKHLDK
jgi:starch synthase